VDAFREDDNAIDVGRLETTCEGGRVEVGDEIGDERGVMKIQVDLATAAIPMIGVDSGEGMAGHGVIGDQALHFQAGARREKSGGVVRFIVTRAYGWVLSRRCDWSQSNKPG
jgi:hypothetical protein